MAQIISAVQHPNLPWHFAVQSSNGRAGLVSAPVDAGITTESCRAWFQAQIDMGPAGSSVEFLAKNDPRALDVVREVERQVKRRAKRRA